MNMNLMKLLKSKIMISKNKYFLLLFSLLFIFLLYFKIDFRFENGIFCCGDDYDYYSHAETIAIDKDFDYSNQLKGFEDRRFNLNGKIAPKGFVGSGLLASPFLFLGNQIDLLIINYSPQNYSDFLSFKLLFYSLSAIFYMSLTTLLLKKSVKYLDQDISHLEILLFYSSSGVIYYAFERYSMPHIYETFTITCVIYFTLKHLEKGSGNIYAFLIPLSMLLAFLVRLTNYYVVIIPLIVKIILKKVNAKNVYLNKFFLFSCLISGGIYAYINNKIYGIVTLNPETLYKANGILAGFVKDINYTEFLLENIKHVFLILFGQEFGIFWFAPIVFFGIFYSTISKNNSSFKEKILLLIPFGMCVFSVLIWKSTASSYGFRYLSSLVPLSIIIFYSNAKFKYFRYFKYLLIVISIFSILSILFFETTELTQLSTTEQLNSFGRNIKYVEPEYLKGVILSFFQFESYLKIFTTSFLGVIVFKFLLSIFDKDVIFDNLANYNLPTNNPDFINYVDEIQIVSSIKIVFIFIFLLYLAIFYLKEFQNE